MYSWVASPLSSKAEGGTWISEHIIQCSVKENKTKSEEGNFYITANQQESEWIEYIKIGPSSFFVTELKYVGH